MTSNWNWDAIADEAVRHLQNLLRLDTRNPPGNEILAAKYLADVLQAEGLKPIILESAPGRANLVARLEGNGAAPPLLLMGHTDVVAVEEEKWTHPPFGGTIADGQLWGRGAVDMKHMVVMELMTLLLLKRQGRELPRTVIYLAAADEETGGEMGAGWMVKHHPELIQAEYAINEGGGQAFQVGEVTYFSVQTGEKGTNRFHLTMRGKPGHASEPHSDNAVLHLARALCRLAEQPLPIHITQTFKAMVEGIAASQPAEVAAQLYHLLDPETADTALQKLPVSGQLRRSFNALLRNTATPTMLKAGRQINVIPSEATAAVDGRVLPGQTQDSFRAELQAVIGDQGAIDFIPGSIPLEFDFDTPLFRAIIETMRDHEPAAHVVPYLIGGATDAKHVHKLGTVIYGFSPMRRDRSGGDSLAHGHDERISLDNVAFGTRVLYDLVNRFLR